MAQGQTETPSKREALNSLLLTFASNVYFQPPTNTGMEYPCIKYELDDVDTIFADNRPYKHEDRYQITLIDSDPDTLIRHSIANLPKCRFDRKFVADNLHHFIYNLYF